VEIRQPGGIWRIGKDNSFVLFEEGNNIGLWNPWDQGHIRRWSRKAEGERESEKHVLDGLPKS
jgi:hypothetical protein